MGEWLDPGFAGRPFSLLFSNYLAAALFNGSTSPDEPTMMQNFLSYIGSGTLITIAVTLVALPMGMLVGLVFA
jgi:ABC-type amino acid transport system permease subunit